MFLTVVIALSVLPVTALAAPKEMPTAVWSDGWPLLPPIRTYENQLTDVSEAWCADAVKTVYEAGLMEGKTAARFDIASSLTNAQIVVISARLHSLLRSGDGRMPAPAEDEAWYRPALDYLLAESEIPADLVEQLANQKDDVIANKPCTRRNFVRLIDSVLVEESHPREVLNPTALPPDTRDEAVVTFYQAGILTGSDIYGTFDESSLLTRGAAAAILARYVDPLQRKRFNLMPFDLCRDVLGVEPETVLLTVNGEEVSAELFAEQLCTSLYQWGGNTKEALKDAIRFWCQYQGGFRVLAKDLGFFFSPEELTAIQENAAGQDGYLGLTAAYWQFREEGIHLNLTMRNYYCEQDSKTGEHGYHTVLEQTADQMVRTAIPTQALADLDLNTVYQRLIASPFIKWNNLKNI